MEIEVLIFECSSRYFGVRASFVTEVLRAVALSPLPNAPAGVSGLVNLRGKVLPVLDTKWLMGLASEPITHTDHFVVVDCQRVMFALHVDHAIDLIKIQTDKESSPEQSRDEAADILPPACSRMVDMVLKTDHGVVQVINPTQILNDESLTELVVIATTVTATQMGG